MAVGRPRATRVQERERARATLSAPSLINCRGEQLALDIMICFQGSSIAMICLQGSSRWWLESESARLGMTRTFIVEICVRRAEPIRHREFTRRCFMEQRASESVSIESSTGFEQLLSSS